MSLKRRSGIVSPIEGGPGSAAYDREGVIVGRNAIAMTISASNARSNFLLSSRSKTAISIGDIDAFERHPVTAGLHVARRLGDCRGILFETLRCWILGTPQVRRLFGRQ